MEQVLVVNRQALEAKLGGQVWVTDHLDDLRQFILDRHTFLPRQQAEYDATVRQIIPYGILRRGGEYFLLRRLKGQTEARLHDKLSLGLGGHINPTEESAADPIEAGLRRELAEEVILTEERNRVLHFCMDEMNPDYREVLYLTYFEDMSYAQAAEVTGKTVKQITNMVYRGKKSLRRLLELEGITNAEL